MEQKIIVFYYCLIYFAPGTNKLILSETHSVGVILASDPVLAKHLWSLFSAELVIQWTFTL